MRDIADTELSRIWAVTWPDGARLTSTKEDRPLYVFENYAKFLERLSILIKTDKSKL